MKAFLIGCLIGGISGEICGTFSAPNYENMALWFIGVITGSIMTTVIALGITK